jgi:hypothetical protein
MKKKAYKKKAVTIKSASKKRTPPATSTTPTLSKYSKAEDCLAALIGNAPSMKDLVQRAKVDEKGNKSFMILIKIYTIIYIADLDEDFIHPALDLDIDFYKQRWVQKKIAAGMAANGSRGRQFMKQFWNAVTYKLQPDYQKYGYSGKDAKDNKSELKRFVVLRQDKWEKCSFSYEDIFNECVDYGVLSENCYAKDPDSFRRYLNKYGVSWRCKGRPKGSLNRI